MSSPRLGPSEQILLDILSICLNEKDNSILHNKLLNYLDAEHHYDFTHVNDNGVKYIRGGSTYYRPCGWFRYALNVLGKYENDNWLSDNNSGYVNAYHGTTLHNMLSILEKSLIIGGTQGIAIKHGSSYGTGIYTSPYIATAAGYATVFNFDNGKQAQIVFQCRIKPSSMIKHNDSIWTNSTENHVRPFGICVRILTNGIVVPPELVNPTQQLSTIHKIELKKKEEAIRIAALEASIKLEKYLKKLENEAKNVIGQSHHTSNKKDDEKKLDDIQNTSKSFRSSSNKRRKKLVFNSRYNTTTTTSTSNNIRRLTKGIGLKKKNLLYQTNYVTKTRYHNINTTSGIQTRYSKRYSIITRYASKKLPSYCV